MAAPKGKEKLMKETWEGLREMGMLWEFHADAPQHWPSPRHKHVWVDKPGWYDGKIYDSGRAAYFAELRRQRPT